MLAFGNKRRVETKFQKEQEQLSQGISRTSETLLQLTFSL